MRNGNYFWIFLLLGLQSRSGLKLPPHWMQVKCWVLLQCFQNANGSFLHNMLAIFLCRGRIHKDTKAYNIYRPQEYSKWRCSSATSISKVYELQTQVLDNFRHIPPVFLATAWTCFAIAFFLEVFQLLRLIYSLSFHVSHPSRYVTWPTLLSFELRQS